MKHYAIALVEKSTGDIEHIAVSDAPIQDDKVGTPDGAELTHQLIRFEFDADPDTESPVMRGRTALAEFEMSGANAAAKSAPGATIRQRVGRTRAANIMIGRQVTPPPRTRGRS